MNLALQGSMYALPRDSTYFFHFAKFKRFLNGEEERWAPKDAVFDLPQFKSERKNIRYEKECRREALNSHATYVELKAKDVKFRG